MSVKVNENSAWRYSNSHKLYESGAWREARSVKTYENGAWVEKIIPPELQDNQILYDNGNEVTIHTGGWNLFKAVNGVALVMVKYDDRLHIDDETTNYRESWGVQTSKAIDLTRYTLLHLSTTLSASVIYGSPNYICVSVSRASLPYIYDSPTSNLPLGILWYSKVELNNPFTALQDITFNVSNINEPVYIQVWIDSGAAQNTMELDIYKIHATV